MEFDIQKRTFLVSVDARIYLLAKKKAEAEPDSRAINQHAIES
jgi:hypothetical protein